MDLNNHQNFISKLPVFDIWARGVVGVITVVLAGLILRQERRHFASRNKASSWLSLRLLSLFVLLPLTTGIIVIVGKAISGPEALAYFYLTLLIIGPLLWFAGHALCGNLLRPAFSQGESLFMAGSGLLVLLLPFTAATLLQEPIFHVSRGLRQKTFQAAPAAALPHAISPVRDFNLPTVGLIHTQSLIAPTGFELERVDHKVGDIWVDTATSMRNVLCRDQQNLHLMWSATEPAPLLRLYWQRDGKRVHADFSPPQPKASDPLKAPEFKINFRPDGFDPPAPIPRSRASIAYFVAPDRLYSNSLTSLQPGENFTNDCIMPGYKRVEWKKEGPPQSVALIFFQSANEPYLRAEIKRSVEPE